MMAVILARKSGDHSMRNASVLYRFAGTMIALSVLVSGCGQSPQSPATAGDVSSVPSGGASSSPQDSDGAPSEPAKPTAPAVEPSQRGQAKTESKAAASAPARPDSAMAPGSIFLNPTTGRNEVIVPDVGHTALLIGDSQSEPAGAWTRAGLAALGYKVYFCGKGGTGFVASNGATGNYLDALRRGDWKLPYGSPPLVVIQGGGNDAAQGATDAQIVANAERLIATLQQRYPDAKFAMIGTLARGTNYGGGRRSQVDSLLAALAAKHNIPFVSVGDWLTRYNLVSDLADAVHMDGDGHKALGVLLADHMRRLGLRAPK